MIRTFLGLLLLCLGARGYDYCQAPLPAYVAPPSDGLQLVQVTALTRHGARSPLAALPVENVAWICALEEGDALLNIGGSDAAPSVVFYERGVAPWAAALTWDGNCTQGQLLLQGAAQCAALGRALRAVYVDKLAFLPAAFDAAAVALRTTDVTRTRQSLLALLHEFYPPATRKEGQAVRIRTTPSSAEDLAPNGGACPRVSQLAAAAKQSAEWVARMKALEPVMQRVNKIAGTTGVAGWDDANSIGRWPDTLTARKCSGLKYPCSASSGECVSEADAAKIFEEFTWQNQRVYLAEEASKLVAGPMLGEILAAMQTKISTGKGPKYQHFSAHDSSQISVLNAYKATSAPFPPFASHMLFELWKNASSAAQQEYFVRTVFNNEPIRPPECPADMCPLEKYAAMIKSRLTITDYAKECAKK